MLLSGGQQQRVALARALVYSPSILLLDEPLTNLDAKLRGQMRIELKRLQERLKVTVLFVTHDQIEAMSLSSRLAVMNQGRIEQLGTPQRGLRPSANAIRRGLPGPRAALPRQGLGTRECAASCSRSGATSNRQLRVDTADDSVAVGDAVTAAIRPEDIRLRATRHRPEAATSSTARWRSHVLGAECELLLPLRRPAVHAWR